MILLGMVFLVLCRRVGRMGLQVENGKGFEDCVCLDNLLVFLSWFLHCCSDEEEEILQARCHYSQAQVDDVVYNLNDDAYIKVSFLDKQCFFFFLFLLRLKDCSFCTMNGSISTLLRWFTSGKPLAMQGLILLSY